ncbi:MAG: dihydrofolate reductase family protein [Desulfobacteraceae bacterium]|nr:dihydrofolate reductase family protein [Desulfobacteraceae bacterium]
MKLILLMAMTADGKIARSNDHFPDWTGKADKRMFKELTAKAGVVIMGSRTFKTLAKPLPGRLNVVMTRTPEQWQPSQNLIFTAAPPRSVLTDLAARGFSQAILTGGATINTLFAHENLIDELMVTMVPKIFGQGLSLFSEHLEANLDLMETKEIEPGILVLHYRFVR